MADLKTSSNKPATSSYFNVNRNIGNIQVDPQISTTSEGVYSLNIFAKENLNGKTLLLIKQVFIFYLRYV